MTWPRRALIPAIAGLVAVIAIGALAGDQLTPGASWTPRLVAIPPLATAGDGPAGAGAVATGTGAAGVGDTRAAALDAARARQLDDALTAVAAANPGTRFAIGLVDHRTGRTYRFNGDASFVTASIVKVEILATLLFQQGQLSSYQQSLASQMIRYSDNDAADALWIAEGESRGMAAAAPAFGLTSTVQGVSAWGYTTTTAPDQANLIEAIADPAGPLGANSGYVLDLMGSVAPDEAWGVSAAARGGETVQLKNGWVDVADDGGRWAVNSIGRVTGPDVDLTLAILSGSNDDYADGVALVEQIATLARDTLDPSTL